MRNFLLKRVSLGIIQLIFLSMIIFILAKMMPGDALTGLIEENPNVTPEQLHELREKLGLLDPWYVQYANWVYGIFQGDLGISYLHKISVTTVIGERAFNTLWLGIAIMVTSYLIALPLGLLSGRYHQTLWDHTITGYSYLTYAIPSFVFALFLLYIFGFQLGWFPSSGSVSTEVDPHTFNYYINKIHHLILPTLTGALLQTTATIQLLRSEVIDNKTSDYVRFLQAKGVPESKIYRFHILRNALMPIVAFLGLSLTGILAGDIFIEKIYSYPGLGELFVSSLSGRDFSIVTALLMISGILALIGTFLSDVMVRLVDPRVKIDH